MARKRQGIDAVLKECMIRLCTRLYEFLCLLPCLDFGYGILLQEGWGRLAAASKTSLKGWKPTGLFLLPDLLLPQKLP